MIETQKIWRTSAAIKRLDPAGIKLFALHGSEAVGAAVAASLGLALALHEERSFEDGEHKLRPLENVAGADAYVLHALHGEIGQSPNDKLVRMLFFAGALRDAGARRVTIVLPYLCYARKDRRTKPHDPLATRYVAQMFQAVGVDAVVALEVHNEMAFENAYDCRTIALSAAPLFVEWALGCVDDRLAVISPDAGGAKRAETFRLALEEALGKPVANALAEKHRSAGVVSGDLFAGDVDGATGIVLDDMISTGNTMLRAARLAKQAGARRIIAVASHGLFMEGAENALGDPAIDEVVTLDTVSSPDYARRGFQAKLSVLPCARLFAETVARLHLDEDMSDLLVY